MALIHEFGYLSYGVTDLEGSVEFFRRVGQLEVSERGEGVVFLTADTNHAWVRLEEREQSGLIRLGFRATDRASLAELRERLAVAGIEVRPGGTLRPDRVDNAFRFTVDGAEIEIYEEMVQLATPPVPFRGLRRALHTVVSVEDVVRSRDFWVDTLDFQRSDQIEDFIVFLRCGNGFHHSIGLAKGQSGEIDHICLLADNVDTVFKFRNHARASGLKVDEPVRHTASGSVSVYIQDPNLGIGLEVCAEHAVISDPTDRGRLLKAGPSTADAWSGGFVGVTPADHAVGRGGGTRAGSMASQTDA